MRGVQFNFNKVAIITVATLEILGKITGFNSCQLACFFLYANRKN